MKILLPVVLLISTLALQWAVPIPSQAQTIKVTAREIPRPGTETQDTLYYSRDRKLTWQDFTGTVYAQSTFIASTFSEFGFDVVAREQKDTIFVDVHLQAYFVKNGSWVRPGEKTPYNLAHEQLHFDITKWIEEGFKDSILHASYTPDLYLAQINAVFLFFWRKMNHLQKQYDQETHHGTNHRQQSIWEQKIKQDLGLGKQPGMPSYSFSMKKSVTRQYNR